MFAAQRAFQAILERGIDRVVGLLAAPDTGARSEAVDRDEH